ncbi:HpcH/HpaI aldolase/citrate lyase family protein [Ovoidimarina sediminis]|uniref:HpcH/HpaI aldolase/citrate lyase family protein n=1 Tax=Ovoidimarina sediminis TaxID=3079856 RepID=UPI002906EE26|nr:CoA ester lyase [Rhodophyticola sp. MJ-SS7]MDU8944599.1 CoA ester lyase [Rhodophyticola sp. MJ-SS7]
MNWSERPWRSVLYIPASKARALEKARGLPVDAIIFDLEDAVAPEEKAAARETLAAALSEGGYGARARLVRVNGLDTEWGQADLDAAAAMDCDAILLPKVGGAADLDRVAARVPGAALWAMMETPEGILNAQEIAGHGAMTGFVLGTNDLAKELQARFRPDRLPLMQALQTCLLAARAAGIPCVDGVYNAFKDDAGLRAECEQGRDLGMDGKTLIHPAQVAIANEVFGPSEADIALAERHIAAFDEAAAKGEGVAVVDGRIVENLHVATARALLARRDAIRALEGA